MTRRDRAPPAGADLSGTRPARVHVVDDDESVRRTAAMLLRARGYEVEVFESATGFLDAFERGAPDCLVLDVRMPGMDGLELQAHLAASGTAPPIVMITGHGDVAMAVTAMRAGAVDFLEKPFTGDAFVAAIESAVRGYVPRADARPDEHETLRWFDALTPRQREVAALLVEGLRNKEIARRLDVSLRTVEAHRAEVLRRTGAATVADLVRKVMAPRG